MSAEPRILLETRDLLGEGPIWDASDQRLYWVDIHGRAIHRYEPSTGDHRRWELPVRPSALARCADRQALVVAAEHGLGFFDLVSERWSPWLQLEDPTTHPENRTNDGRCGPDGAFWVGTMHDAVAERSGSLYRIDSEGSVEVLLEGLGIPNTLAWGNNSFYFGDSLDGAVRRYPSAGPGPSGVGEEFFTLPPGDACPDGSAIDAEGRLWTCVWDGGRVDCHAADGSLVRSVPLPVQRPTSCAFGGPELDRLFITSSGKDLPAPNGALLVIDGLCRGLAEPLFG